MDAGDKEGRLVIPPVWFNGKHFFANVDTREDELRAEALNRAGDVIALFTRENCAVTSTEQTLQSGNWKGAKNQSTLSS